MVKTNWLLRPGKSPILIKHFVPQPSNFRAVTDSINHLVNVCTSAAPGQTECDNAIRKIQAMRYLLEKPSEPINDCSYFESLDCIIDKSKALGEALTGMTTTARLSEHERFAEHIKSFSSVICSLIETSAQAAYLVSLMICN